MKHDRRTWAGRGWRRGAGIAVIVVVLAILNIAVLGSVAASGDEAAMGAMRLETTRALYAAESGAIIAVRLTLEGSELPAAGTTLSLTNASVQFIAKPPTGRAGNIVIIGTSGTARRRVTITLVEP